MDTTILIGVKNHALRKPGIELTGCGGGAEECLSIYLSIYISVSICLKSICTIAQKRSQTRVHNMYFKNNKVCHVLQNASIVCLDTVYLSQYYY